MRERKNFRKKIKICVGAVLLVLCTAIGGYGILTAPASDQKELEKELRQNEQALEDADAAAQTTAETPDTTTNPSGTEQPDNSEEEKETPEELISVIGDSVFLGAAPSFQKLYKNTVIDAKISRQVYQAIDIAKKLDKKGKLGNTVIIALGTNGKFNPRTGQELLDYLGSGRTVYWINAYGKKLDFQKEVNKTIEDLADKNPNVRIIHWDTEGKKHPDWFYQDGTHLNTKGQEGFAAFVQEIISSYKSSP